VSAATALGGLVALGVSVSLGLAVLQIKIEGVTEAREMAALEHVRVLEGAVDENPALATEQASHLIAVKVASCGERWAVARAPVGGVLPVQHKVLDLVRNAVRSQHNFRASAYSLRWRWSAVRAGDDRPEYAAIYSPLFTIADGFKRNSHLTYNHIGTQLRSGSEDALRGNSDLGGSKDRNQESQRYGERISKRLPVFLGAMTAAFFFIGAGGYYIDHKRLLGRAALITGSLVLIGGWAIWWLP